MKMGALAYRYARALSQTLHSTQEFDSVAEEIEAVSKLLGADSALRAMFQNPRIPRSRRNTILDDLVKVARLSPKMARFINVLNEHDRLGMIGEVASALGKIRDERNGVVEAEVTTAVPLDEPLSKKWEDVLAAVTGRRVRLKTLVDPEIIGGAVARIGSLVYDGSVRSRMATLRQRLVGR